ncbi:glycosyltransferase family 4 protein [Azospirillum rugosum]|uniref:Glycosyltransferase involved in cell wall biosynthesis n=1 Tax=Azospirillum rugosum TaxID=416170 RepID=A0ABS4SG84_9PROT|nr:glycosyltransferase family 4 protein [Azospirillum rugosum]MBP2291440.1 glycosyltransferase involved in cell wall biosynthesis [Azospirillum rugosum]MDQ0525228.1 glycosyltransferase involved in cell wall biosynthesis [Azospirillum rugosum]
MRPEITGTARNVGPTMAGPAKVAIVYRIVPHYRVAFYKGLSAFLARRGVELTLFGGQPLPEEAFEDCGRHIDCHVFAPNRYVHKQIYYQPLFNRLKDFDLVVVEQANSALLNYPLFLRRMLGVGPRLAFWGHGDDLQQQAPARLRRAMKRFLSCRVDHWFAYTDSVKSIVRNMGFPETRITVVQNAIDVSATLSLAEELTPAGRTAIRERFGLPDAPTAVFCARLMEGKGLPFLIDACERARARIPNLHLLVIGQGPLGPWLDRQAKEKPWIRPLGARYGREKAEILSTADVFLLPSFVGLSILDAFAAGLPVLTADFRNHSPEVDYLQDRVNGLFVTGRPDPDTYGAAITDVLTDDSLRRQLRDGALQTARHRTVDAMVSNFGSGILQALDATGRFSQRAAEPAGSTWPVP